MPEKRKILITGSSGMLGVDLWQELGEDYEVYGVDLVQRTAYGVQRFEKCDITDKDEIANLILQVHPEIVIHTAAWTDVDGCELDKEKAYRINSVGTENVAIACKNTGAALIYISTDFVFDGKKKTPYKETDKPDPLSIYAESKLKGETAVIKTLKNYFILRTGWLYGKNGKNFVDTIIAKSKVEKELKVVDDQIGSPTYTKDLSKAVHKLLDLIFTKYDLRNTLYGTYHISNSGSVSWYKYAMEILKLIGSNTKAIAITSEELNRPAKRPAMSILDNSKFTKFTGYKMRDWKTALEESITKNERAIC